MTTTAHARLTDPYTSHAAAAVATRSLPTVRAAVYRILEEAGEPITHDDLIRRYRQAAMKGVVPPRTTDSSIRSRCNELERDGLVVVPTDELGRSRHGNTARLHCAISVYQQETPRPQEALL